MTDPTPAFKRTATVLTAAGALPFLGLLAGMAVLDPPTNLTASFWLTVYASVILSFLGGIRWGIAVATASGSPLALAISVLPALAAWVIVPYAILVQQIPSPEWFLAYALLFALQLVWDMRSATVPAWFKPVRLTVSAVVIASMIGAWAVRMFLN